MLNNKINSHKVTLSSSIVWVDIDATNKILGRLATEVTSFALGKHLLTRGKRVKIRVFNCSRIIVTGRKPKQKIYYRHSQYPGGLKSIPLVTYFKNNRFTNVIQMSIKGMLPKNTTSRKFISNDLYLYNNEITNKE